jgi:hypothetical protein
MEASSPPGRRRWYIGDGYLAPDSMDKGDLISHEAICILNVGREAAHCMLTIYFEDREPARDIQITVAGERTWHVRLDRPEHLGGVEIPRGVPYALSLQSDHNVIVQHSRLDTRQPNLAYFTAIGYAEE